MMKLKSIIIVNIILMILMAAAGMYCKSFYQDYNSEDVPLKNFVTGVMSEGLLDVQLERYDSELASSNYIIAVQCQEKSFFRHSCTTQKVKIEHVFKGNDLREGDIVEIAKYDSEIFNSEEMKINGMNCMNMGFVNEMIPGYTYLIFLDKKINTHNEKSAIYVTKDFIMSPIFCYNKIKNKPCNIIDENSCSSWYGDIKNNEFFLISENAIQKMEEYREKLINEYTYSTSNDN